MAHSIVDQCRACKDFFPCLSNVHIHPGCHVLVKEPLAKIQAGLGQVQDYLELQQPPTRDVKVNYNELVRGREIEFRSCRLDRSTG